jgi:hypothetical protein
VADEILASIPPHPKLILTHMPNVVVRSLPHLPNSSISPIDLPLDLRHKKTRAIRRRLTHKESHAITEKQHKRQIHFPVRSELRSSLLMSLKD